MKIVVIGGTGLIGSRLVNKLREHGHEAIPASPNSGVNTVTAEVLAEVLKGASVGVVRHNTVSFRPSTPCTLLASEPRLNGFCRKAAPVSEIPFRKVASSE